MPKRKSSKIHHITDEQLLDAIKHVSSLRQLMSVFELKGGSTFVMLRERIKTLGVYEKFQEAQFWNRGKSHLTDERIRLKSPTSGLTQSSQLSTSHAKKLFIRVTNAALRCNECKLDVWMGSKLVLELDHINGDNRDNRIENLRLLCPNCHSLTPTWRGKNKNSGTFKVTDQVLLQALKTESTVSKALQKVGLAGGGNYARCYKLLIKNTHS